MSDQEIDLEQHEGLDPNLREALKGRNQLARDKQAAEERAAQLERELAFTRAGIPDTPLTATLAKTYDGDNDPTAIKAYFEGLGVGLTAASAGTPAHPPEPSGPSEAELAAQRQISQLGGGGEPGGDLRFEDAIGSAGNANAVMELIRSAPDGAQDRNGFRIATPEIN